MTGQYGMKCYCYETDKKFIYCVENAEGIYENLLADPYWTQTGDGKFVKIYPLDTGFDDAWHLVPEYKQTIANNFSRLGQSWLEGIFDWTQVLAFLAQTFRDNGIEWWLMGSASEAVLGVDIKPHDIDVAVHTRDFYKAKVLFQDYTVEPFVDNKGGWLVRYFGKLCVYGASVDIAADDKLDVEYHEGKYERVSWNGFNIFITPLRVRYETELQRNRKDRINAIEAYINKI